MVNIGPVRNRREGPSDPFRNGRSLSVCRSSKSTQRDPRRSVFDRNETSGFPPTAPSRTSILGCRLFEAGDRPGSGEETPSRQAVLGSLLVYRREKGDLCPSPYVEVSLISVDVETPPFRLQRRLCTLVHLDYGPNLLVFVEIPSIVTKHRHSFTPPLRSEGGFRPETPVGPTTPGSHPVRTPEGHP